MRWLKRLLGSTVGTKLLVGLTGLGLVGFLVGHMLGNLQLFYGDGGEAFNAYADWLHGLSAFPVIEIGLALLFVTHIALTVKLTRDNRAARGSRYVVRGTKREGFAGLMASRTMAISGVIVLVFLVVHINDFRLEHAAIVADPGTTLYDTVMAKLATPWRAVLYMVASLLVGWHVFHGFSSAFRSLGTTHRRLLPALDKAGIALAGVLGLVFAAIPFWIFFIR